MSRGATWREGSASDRCAWRGGPAPSSPAALLLAGAAALSPLWAAAAQGVATAGVSGTVRMADGGDADGARIAIRNTVNGFTVETEVRRGRFLMEGLTPGGPYTLEVRRIGAVPRRVSDFVLNLGDHLELDLILEPAALRLDSVVVTAAPRRGQTHGGTATTLSDSLIHRLPSQNRDVYDFLRLVPQISTRIGVAAGGLSGGGAGFRYNHFLTNGVPERSLSGGQPPEFAGGKSLPFEAVREYQVLIAPFDVRYGDFAGAMVNTITRTGSNRLEGSVFAQGRSDGLARTEVSPGAYDRWQAGLSLAGPLVRDRAQMVLAAEFEGLNTPMAGPYVGQPPGAEPPVPVLSGDLVRFDTLLRTYGLTAGSGAAIPGRNQRRNLFARLDAALPAWNSRVVLWVNDANIRDRQFSRADGPERFLLTSHAATTVFGTRTLAVQVHTTLKDIGGSNEVSFSHRGIPFGAEPAVRQPIVQVLLPSPGGGLSTAVTGSPSQAQSDGLRLSNLHLRDDLTLPLGRAHSATLGIEAEWFRLERGGIANRFGTWTFLSLDSLEARLADRYEVAQDLGSGQAALTGSSYAAWAGNQWRPSARVSLTFGVRADLVHPHERAPYNPTVDSVFGRRTDLRPLGTMELSPRLGFTWNLPGGGQQRLRGGLGLFVGRPPLAWLHVPLQNHGDGVGVLRCGTLAGDHGLPPPFDPDPEAPPLRCAGGEGLAGPPHGDVDLVHRDLRMARALRTVLAYERGLPGQLLGTVEALMTHHLSDFVFVNLNLAGPQGRDRHGRVLYGSFDAQGRARPVRVTGYPSVVELQNTSGNHATQVSLSLSRPFDRGVSVLAYYTWSQVRDVQTPLRVNTAGAVNWALTAVSGEHERPTTGVSLNDVPHRVALAGTWRAPWQRWSTEVSLLYVGESGSPFTYRVGGVGGRGDLNADGALNDPVYVPVSALDPGEILFSGLSTEPGADNSAAAQAVRVHAQRAELEAFIENSPCLRRQRGRIMARNSCREPWVNTTAASLRQTIPVAGGGFEAQLDVFNVLNLVDRHWGLRRVVSSPVLLQHVEDDGAVSGLPEPRFHYTTTAAWRVEPAESAFQFQFGLRYRF